MLDESLSALIDGELDADSAQRLLERIKREPELRAAWTRQHLLKAALRGGSLLAPHRISVAEAVARQIQSEAVSTKVVDLTSRIRKQPSPGLLETPLHADTEASPAATLATSPQPSRARTTAFGMALAASVAAVAMLIPLLTAQSPMAPTSMAQQAVPAQTGRVAWSGVDNDTARELNSYLLEHHNAAEYTLASVPGSARLATGLQDAAYRR